MAVIRLYMTMSLDGYIAGPQDDADAPLGVGGFRLFNWPDRRNDPGPSGQEYSEAMSTRAVISGRRNRCCSGRGRRLFDHLPAEHVELDLVRRLTTPETESPAQQVMHLRYRVRRP
ncbi:hypothetical protein [Actinomadura monticuli]|uniref:Dihydrofolate reductase n=1 Tax=Actinomadura monticuli TaxID=3097367 RepID=A0ABV4Q819_9ACTN